MTMQEEYFIDLDDTLVNSTALNNDAYNFNKNSQFNIKGHLIG